MRTGPAASLGCLLALLAALPSVTSAAAPLGSPSSEPENGAYGAWHGERFRSPPARFLDRPPLPLDEEPESARRLFEVAAELGVAMPHCARSHGTGCATLAGGTELGLMLLARPSPYFSFGAELRFFAFSLPNGEASSEAARASAMFAGAFGRVYFFEGGSIDPYLELALGAGSLDLTAQSGTEASSQEVKFAPAARSAAGIDFVLSSFLRMGPFLALTRYAPASVAHCAARACVALEPRSSGIAVGATSLGLRLTLAAGELL